MSAETPTNGRGHVHNLPAAEVLEALARAGWFVSVACGQARAGGVEWIVIVIGQGTVSPPQAVASFEAAVRAALDVIARVQARPADEARS